MSKLNNKDELKLGDVTFTIVSLNISGKAYVGYLCDDEGIVIGQTSIVVEFADKLKKVNDLI